MQSIIIATVLVIPMFLISSSAKAESYLRPQKCCIVDTKEEKKEEKEPKVVYKTKWKTKTVTKKVLVPVKVPVKVKPKEKCCRRGERTVQKAQTGNQKIIINMPKQKTKIKYRTKVKYKEKIINETNPNRIQVLVGASKSKTKIESINCCEVGATNEHELDVGLQYLRDFGGFTGSVSGSARGNFNIGLGLNW